MIVHVGIVTHVIIAVIHLVVIALDVTLFFLISRSLANKWPIPLCLAFDKVGSPLVDRLLQAARPLGGSRQTRLLLVFLGLSAIRLGLAAATQSFWIAVP